MFPDPVPLKLTLHANMSTNEQPDGIKILWGELNPTQSSPISYLIQNLMKESMKLSTFQVSFSEQKEQMVKKKDKLLSDMEIFVKEKEEDKKNTLKKALLLINSKKTKIRELCDTVQTLENENEELKKELFELKAKKKTKRGTKRAKKK
jgi:septal ring factor EnvC (AmiA/AmiB activator)